MSDNMIVIICILCIVIILLTAVIFSIRKKNSSLPLYDENDNEELKKKVNDKKLRENLWAFALHDASLKSRGKL